MPVTIFRWHSKDCQHYRKPDWRKLINCGCPWWADGKPLREKRSLGTRDRGEALRLQTELELNGGVMASREDKTTITYADARDRFFKDTLHYLRRSTLRKHLTLHGQLAYFLASRRISNLTQITADDASDFFHSWSKPNAFPIFKSDGTATEKRRKATDGNHSAQKKLERVNQFFTFTIERGWLKTNPFGTIEKPEFENQEAKNLTAEMFESILATVRKRIAESNRDSDRRLYALILFMRFSGLRIGDAVSCRVEWVKDGRVRLVPQKNSRRKSQKKKITTINVVLPDVALEALATVPKASDTYFFWSGNGQLDSWTKDYQEKFKRLFAEAGIKDGNSHRFRHTFAAARIAASDGNMQDLADALGDTLAVTERNYNWMSPKRQENQDAMALASWEKDPTLEKLRAEKRAASKTKVRSIRRTG